MIDRTSTTSRSSEKGRSISSLSGVLQKGRIFYGWWIVAGLWISLFIGVGIIFYSYGVFFVFWERELGWSRTAISGAFSVGSAIPAAIMPFLGRLVERYGSRRIMLAGALVMGLGFFLLSQMSSPWQLFLFYTIATLGFTLLGHVPIAMTLAAWFEKKRGLAIGLAHTGMGAGGVVMTPLATYLAANLGWRPTAAILGLIVWVALVPLILLVIRSRPQDMGLLPDSADASAQGTVSSQKDVAPLAEGATLGEALRSLLFWMTTIAFVVNGVGLVGVWSQQIPYLTDLKFPLATAAIAASVSASMHVVGKVLFGFLSDRVPPRYVLSLGFSFGLIGVIGFLLTRNIAIALAASAFLGLAGSVSTVLQPVIVGSYFGNRSLGSILGVLFAINTVGISFGPVISGRAFDLAGNYAGIFQMYAVGILLAAIVPLLVKPHRKSG